MSISDPMDDTARAPGDAAGLIDGVRLLTEVGDEALVAEAYRRTFDTPHGRIVLLDALARLGRVGTRRGREVSPVEGRYLDGRADAVLDLAELAGFAPVAVAMAVMTQHLEGAIHEQPVPRGRSGGLSVPHGDIWSDDDLP